MAEITVQRAIEMALEHQQAGRPAEAEGIFRQLHDVFGENADVLNGLGIAAYNAGLHETALQLFRRVVALRPDLAGIHHFIGVALRTRGQLSESLDAFRSAAAINPANVEYCCDLASTLRALTRSPEAIEVLKSILAISPNAVAPHVEMGRALQDVGRLPDAIESFHRAIALQPQCAAALHQLGIVFGMQHRLAEAIDALGRAAIIEPNNAAIQMDIGYALHEIGKLDAAAEAFSRSIRLAPAEARPLLGLGNVLVDMDRYDDAIESFQRAVALRPDYVPALCNLALALQNLGRVPEAIPIYRRAIAQSPDSPEIHEKLLFAMNLLDTIDPAELLSEHQRWAERFANPFPSEIPIHLNDRLPDRALRVGYVSPDLHSHSVATFLLPILESHDRRRFHITCYSNSWIDDDVTKRVRAAVAAWRTTADWTDDRLAAQIREDRIDILVDLAQHTAGNRLLVFARRPAPVQVTYLGYPGTTGLKIFDARLSDPRIDPPGTTEHLYSERTVRFPETYWCFRPTPDAPPVQPPAANANGFITFGCLNKFAKVSSSALRLWTRILQHVPRSRLVLSTPSGAIRQKILDIMIAGGVDPKRVELIAWRSFRDYLCLCHRIDIALDPFPYNGGTTTCQSLWMGVPVVTLAGIAGVQRSGVSLMSNAGMPELVAATKEQYVQIAVELAGDLPRLSLIRATMRDRMAGSPLTNVPRFVGGLESVFQMLWRERCARQ